MSSHSATLLTLASGEIVVSLRADQEGWHTIRILWAPESSTLRPGGHDFVIAPQDIAAARETTIGDDLAAAIIAESEPTYEAGLVVIGGQFRATHPDANPFANPPHLLWTIEDVDGFTVTCRSETGETTRFGYRWVTTARSLHGIASRATAAAAVA